MPQEQVQQMIAALFPGVSPDKLLPPLNDSLNKRRAFFGFRFLDKKKKRNGKHRPPDSNGQKRQFYSHSFAGNSEKRGELKH